MVEGKPLAKWSTVRDFCSFQQRRRQLPPDIDIDAVIENAWQAT
jgi:hypothetical protein